MKILALILFTSIALFGQQDGITTSVTRSTTLPGDEAVFSVGIATDLNTSQDQALQPLRDAGAPSLTIQAVTAGQSAVSTYPPPTAPAATVIFYVVSFTTPAPSLKDMAQKLDAIRLKL